MSLVRRGTNKERPFQGEGNILYILIGTVLHRYRHTLEIIMGLVSDHCNESKYCNKASEMNFLVSQCIVIFTSYCSLLSVQYYV